MMELRMFFRQPGAELVSKAGLTFLRDARDSSFSS